MCFLIRPDLNSDPFVNIPFKWFLSSIFDVIVAIAIIIVVVVIFDVVRAVVVVIIIWLLLMLLLCWVQNYSLLLQHILSLTIPSPRPHIYAFTHAHTSIRMHIYVNIHNYLNINIKWKLIIRAHKQTTRPIPCGFCFGWQQHAAHTKNHLRNYFTLISESHAKANYSFMLAVYLLELYHLLWFVLFLFSRLSVVHSAFVAIPSENRSYLDHFQD